MKPEMSRWRPLRLEPKFDNEEMAAFMKIFKKKLWTFSFASPLFLIIPASLFIVAVDSNTVYAWAEVLLAVLLTAGWLVVPAVFLFERSKESSRLRYLFYGWIGYASVMIGVSLYIASILFPLT
ncbi:MAG TPA: hypothetical protein VFK44_11230 [Bacillales bacterium]|nr:hypothetical protein [Bacillales bacterium]